jgi:hypothetical protein
MQEYVKITQANQEMLGRMSNTDSLVIPEPPVVFKETVKEAPILNAYADPLPHKEEVGQIKKL